MKLVSAVAALACSAMADKWAILGDKLSSFAAADTVNEDRKVMELFTTSSINNYGCWCRFNEYKPYKGIAQDTVDEACKQWHKNHDCLHNDFSTKTPFFRCGEDHDYVEVITSLQDAFSVTADYAALCADANAGDDCAINLCFIDAVFLRDVYNFLSENTLNMTLSGWYGFDGSTCRLSTTKVGTTDVTTDCCGAYPDRFPYKLNNGNRQCCIDTTYNVNILECCQPSNILNFIGTC